MVSSRNNENLSKMLSIIVTGNIKHFEGLSKPLLIRKQL